MLGVETRLRDELAVPRLDDDVEQERPRPDMPLVGDLVEDRRDDVLLHRGGHVLVPRFDHAGADQLSHLHERRHADVDVPRALLLLRLGDEAVDAEALYRRDLRVERVLLGVLLVDRSRDVRVDVVDPLVERRGQSACARATEGIRRSVQQGERRQGKACSGATAEQLPPIEGA